MAFGGLGAGIRILGMAQLLVIVNSRERCTWDVRMAYWRREKSRRSEASAWAGSFYKMLKRKVFTPQHKRE